MDGDKNTYPSQWDTCLRAFRVLHGEVADVAAICVYALAVGLCSLAIPVGVQAVVNTVTFGVVLQPLVVITALVGGALLFSAILRVLQLTVVELLQRRLIVRLSLSLASRIPHVEFEGFKRRYGPEYVLRFMEAFSSEQAISTLMLDGIAVFFQIFVGLILVSFYHPFFLAFASILLACMVLVIVPLGSGAVRASTRASDAKYEVMTWLQDLARVPVLFKSNRGDAFAIERADALVADYVSWRSRYFRILLRQVISSLGIQVIASTLLLGIGGFLVIKQQLTLGQLVAAELVLGFSLAGVAKLSRYIDKFYDLSVSVAKLDGLFDVPTERLQGSFFSPGAEPANLSVINVSVQHPKSATPVLRDISFDIQPGEKAAIWGPNGSGKSTLVDCIYRLTSPKSGRIEIDGHDVRDIHALELRSEVVLVRGIDIFHGTIEENLTLMREGMSSARVREALAMVGVLEDIYQLPDGLQTVLKGQSEPLSLGQAARLVLARAILLEPRLLVIDGVLDGIDEDSLPPLLERIVGPDAPWSLLVLSHEKSIIKHFTKTYVLNHGTLVPACMGGHAA